MPTGVALSNARGQLFAAAERILLRDGPQALTSRAVAVEAGVAKGVLHRHFADFDDFLAELVRQRIEQLRGQAERWRATAGTATVVGQLAQALTDIFDPIALSVVGLVTSRDALRARLRRTTPAGIPLLTEATSLLSGYLSTERDRGRLAPESDVDTLAFTLIGTGHLLFAGELGAPPRANAVEEIVASIIVGAEPAPRADQ